MVLPRFLRYLLTPFQVFVLPNDAGGSSSFDPTSPSAQDIYEAASPQARALLDQLNAELELARAAATRPPALKVKAPKLPDPRTFNGSRNTRALSDYLYDVKQHFKVDPL
ncbi:hypothetical protein OC846_006931, partial [Tilletia horrida]